MIPTWLIFLDYILGMIMWTLIGRAFMNIFQREDSTFFFMRVFVKYTDPIIIPGGFLILKLNNIKKDKIKYDVEQKLNELIRITTNQQLNQLSNIFFDKVKREIKIEKL